MRDSSCGPFRVKRALLLLAITTLAPGCLGGSSAAPQQQPITLVLASQFKGYDIEPSSAYAPVAQPLFSVLSDGLVGYRRVAGAAGDQLVPDLAASIPAPGDGGRTWTFHIRSGIRYSTGQLVVASDFRRAIERDFLLNSPGLYAVRGISGAAGCVGGRPCSLEAGIVADDAAGSVTFHLTASDPEFPFKLTLPMTYPLPPGVPNTAAVVNPLPGTGPYRIASYRPGSEMVMERNPQFHQWSAAAQPAGYPDRIVIRLGLSKSAVFTMVEHGRATWAEGFAEPSAAQLTALKQSTVVRTIVPAYTSMLFLNTKIAPFDRVDARRAVSLVVDRRRLLSAVGFDAVHTTCRLLPEGFPGYRGDCPTAVSVSDVALARQLVRGSGTSGATVKVVASSTPAGRGLTAELVRELDSIGYRASAKLVASQAEYTTNADSRNRVQVGYQAWSADYPSPNNFFTPLLNCSAFVPASPHNDNLAEFCDPAIDAAVRSAVAAGGIAPAGIASRWAAIDRRITASAPIVPLFTGAYLGVVSRSARHVVWNNQWFLLFDLMHPR